MMLDPVVTVTVQLFIALLLLAAGVHKGAELSRLTAAVLAYRVVPEQFGTLVACLVIAVEMIIGSALLIPSTRESASLAAAGVFAGYFLIMGLSLVRGHHEVDCGCSFSGTVARLSGAHLVRNVVLVILAALASLPESARTVGWLDGVQIAAAVLCLALIYLSAELLLSHKLIIQNVEA